MDLLRFDHRFNIVWDINEDKPFSKKYILANVSSSRNISNVLYAFILFLISSSFLLFIPTNNKFELRDVNNTSQTLSM